jgi:small subunit ribosomal protein S3Ae
MAVGKNKRLTKGGKKGSKKKIADPYSKKDWYDVKAPSMFQIRNIGKTLVTRTTGTKIAADGLKGRVFEVSLADLQNSEEEAHRKIKLCADEVQGKHLLTNFHGLDFTTDKLRSLVKKWHTLIEAIVDVKTSDNYIVRVFTIAFTKRRPNQVKKTSYAQHAQIRQIRKKMTDIITKEVSTADLKEFVAKLLPESIGKEIEKACQGIYPLQNVFVRKVKVLRKPKLDMGKLLELHGDSAATSEDTGAKVERGDFVEPAVLASV